MQQLSVGVVGGLIQGTIVRRRVRIPCLATFVEIFSVHIDGRIPVEVGVIVSSQETYRQSDFEREVNVCVETSADV